MEKAICIKGIGEMGGVFARAFLKKGYPVFPWTKGISSEEIMAVIPDPKAVIIAVREAQLDEVLHVFPSQWQDRIVLLQNELLPFHWQKHQIENPTVISVWFEKKLPYDYKPIISSPIYGPKAVLIKEALATLGIPSHVVSNSDELLFELVVKNLYILTVNIAGLEVGGTVGELWENHQALCRSVAEEILAIQFALIGKELDPEKCIQAMVKAFQGDLQHKCLGRSAMARLERSVSLAKEKGIGVPNLEAILKKQQKQ